MMIFIAFVAGGLIVDFYHKLKIIRLLEQLSRVCDTGDKMWCRGVAYTMEQIKKIL